MGRPKKQPADRRSASLACRLTASERLRIEHAATRAGLTPSDYVRQLALTGRVIIQKKRGLDHAAFDQLRRIGVNLNQLTRLAHETGRIPAGIAKAAAAVERIVLRELEPGSGPAAKGGGRPDNQAESDGA